MTTDAFAFEMFGDRIVKVHNGMNKTDFKYALHFTNSRWGTYIMQFDEWLEERDASRGGRIIYYNDENFPEELKEFSTMLKIEFG